MELPDKVKKLCKIPQHIISPYKGCVQIYNLRYVLNSIHTVHYTHCVTKCIFHTIYFRIKQTNKTNKLYS